MNCLVASGLQEKEVRAFRIIPDNLHANAQQRASAQAKLQT